MRAFFRTLINLILAAVAAGTVGWVTTLKVYHHASHDGRIAMLTGIAAVFFLIACVVLRAVPSKAQLARRQKARKQSSPYAATAKSGR